MESQKLEPLLSMEGNEMKKYIRRASIVLLSFVLLGGLVVTATANEYLSSRKSITVYGYSYEYWSGIYTINSQYVTYSSYARAVNGTLAGYIGQRPRLYTADGTLIEAADWNYNAKDYSGSTSWQYPWIYHNGVKGTYYYSRGHVKFYNGNGYTTAYSANATPNIVASLSARNVDVNEKGEVFGSELFLSDMGVEPDLIKAVGNEGKVGYVKSDDLNYGDDVSTPDEALNFVAAQNPTRTIPVYMSDGETVIDLFTVYSGQIYDVIEVETE